MQVGRTAASLTATCPAYTPLAYARQEQWTCLHSPGVAAHAAARVPDASLGACRKRLRPSGSRAGQTGGALLYATAEHCTVFYLPIYHHPSGFLHMAAFAGSSRMTTSGVQLAPDGWV